MAPPPPDPPRPPRPRRRRASLLPVLLPIAVLIVAAVAVGSWLQFTERQAIDTVHTAGSAAADRVDVEAVVQRVDATANELVLRVWVIPRGALGEADGSAPVGELSLQTSGATLGDLDFRAHERIPTKDVQVALMGGSVSDYPFDTYETDIGFRAQLDGKEVPVRLLLSNNDTLFAVSAQRAPSGQAAVMALEVSRSGSLLVFAVFMMVVMWALAASVLIGTWYLTTRGEGVVWPALGWMAATLFALSAFRNTAPGSPPIGCVLDWFAFLWAETVIALCVIAVVLAGVRTALRADDGEDDGPGDGPGDGEDDGPDGEGAGVPGPGGTGDLGRASTQ
ncbi:DUF4436 family protein [Streptomyces erythrochromogenes]|uniref:DUF4436 family protein n=1 Tax=Streptomyces erythrochromogenes TaxID=285574 RepID=UPI00386F923F|nr:DUF4436 domain-containing protein [Streptomyces erythrochromogenes]